MTTLAPTFQHPALGPQAVFRTLLDALARPGRPLSITGDVPGPPAPAAPALYAAALALIDFETPVWLDATLQPLAPTLRFHTGAPLVEDPANAAFALIGNPLAMPSLAAFAQGTAEHPDRSTTLLLQVTSFAPGPWRLTGPGIKAATSFGATGLASDFPTQWRTNHARFPQGVDLFLTAGHHLAGLPRTTWIEG
ncbi:MAG: phosphonate C-P lyase system protein PhnH [Geminicoccaceae bacterium]|nr:MAG: phosphonate C-P lyase system protein PhnH [Geminicoccaceae bacterium]